MWLFLLTSMEGNKKFSSSVTLATVHISVVQIEISVSITAESSGGPHRGTRCFLRACSVCFCSSKQYLVVWFCGGTVRGPESPWLRSGFYLWFYSGLPCPCHVLWVSGFTSLCCSLLVSKNMPQELLGGLGASI